MIVKGGNFKFTPGPLYNAMMDSVVEVSQIAARRMESDAKAYLAERITGPKTSSTLEKGIRGFVKVGSGVVYCGVTASALELGQWESSLGESAEAAYATSRPAFDYAGVVEEGSGEYGPTKTPIRGRGGPMYFWNGEYKSVSGGFNRVVIRATVVKGQKGKKYLSRALEKNVRQVYDLLGKVAVSKIRINDIARWD